MTMKTLNAIELAKEVDILRAKTADKFIEEAVIPAINEAHRKLWTSARVDMEPDELAPGY